MKWIIVLSLLFTSFVVRAKTMSLEEFRGCLEKYRGNNRIAVEGVLPFETLDDVVFYRHVAENWQQALAVLGEEGLDQWQQIIVIVAAGFIPPQDYVRFLNGVCDLVESGKLKVQELGWVVSDNRSYILKYNYDHPKVASVIERMEVLYKTKTPEHWEKQWKDYFSKMKSGELKQEMIKQSTQYGWPLPDTYKTNSKKQYHWLVNIHEKILTGKSINELLDEEEEKMLLAEEMNNNNPAPTESTSWKLPLLIGIITISCVTMAWRYFKKN